MLLRALDVINLIIFKKTETVSANYTTVLVQVLFLNTAYFSFKNVMLLN